MTKTENSKTITVYLDEEIQMGLKKMAKDIGISRNRMALNILIIGLDEAEMFKPVVKLVALAASLKDKIQGSLSRNESPGRSAEVWEKPEKTKTMTIYMSNDLLARVDNMVDISGINRNRLISNMLTVGLEEAEALWLSGIGKVAVFARDLRDMIRERIRRGTIDEERDRASGPRPTGLSRRHGDPA